MEVVFILAFLGPFVVSTVLALLVRRWARRIGFVDRPGGHKLHAQPVALGGGIAITLAAIGPVAVGVAVAAVLRGQEPLPAWLPEAVAIHVPGVASKFPLAMTLCLCALFLHVVGLQDDRRAMGPLPKFLGQFLVAIVVAGPLGVRAIEALPPAASILVTVLWIVLITNAFNFLDNMDGLSAGVGAICCVIFAVAAASAGQVFVPALALVLAGSLCGFLIFNFAPARLFMGDAGSLPTGFLISTVTILTNYYQPGAQSPLEVLVLIPLVVLSVPLYDVASVLMHRIRLGHSPFRGDQRHFSHRLVKRGMSTRQAVLTIYLATTATGFSAIVMARATQAQALTLVAQCVLIVAIVAILEHAGPGGKVD